MEIQKYRAKIKNSQIEIIGYIAEIREYIGNGSYTNNTDYLMSVTCKSMPNSIYRGTFAVDKNTIKKSEEQ